MLALPAVGTYEIDYIKLTNVYENNEEDEVGNIYEFTVVENAEYNIIISKQNNTEIGTYYIEYDSDKLELVDACAMTYLSETEVRQVVGTDISITSIGTGTITFVVSDKTASGMINCLKFNGLDSDTAEISVETDIE